MQTGDQGKPSYRPQTKACLFYSTSGAKAAGRSPNRKESEKIVGK
jgi:hypothetical protein